jgi:hypothetical protein
MRKAAMVSALLCASLLGATLFRERVVEAARRILPVKVMNTSAEAVPVREQATLQPVQVFVFGSFPAGERFSSEETLYTVPDGKTLVIEAFSSSSNMAATDRFNGARLGAQLTGLSDEFTWFLHPTDEGVNADTGARIFRGSAQVTAYAGPGTTVVAQASREGAALSGTAVSFRIAGHLVDTP